MRAYHQTRAAIDVGSALRTDGLSGAAGAWVTLDRVSAFRGAYVSRCHLYEVEIPEPTQLRMHDARPWDGGLDEGCYSAVEDGDWVAVAQVPGTAIVTKKIF